MSHVFYVERRTLTLHGQEPNIAQIVGYSYVQNAEVVAINAQNVKNIVSIKHS
jgi:hypothetical protein